MATGMQFLGQNIVIGEYSGDPQSRTIITSMAEPFVVAEYWMENGFFSEDSEVLVCADSNGNNVFAIGYQHTNDYGLRCFVKWANSTTGLIPADDSIPKYAPWNNWIMLGTDYLDYGGITSTPDAINPFDIANNTIFFFKQNQALYPYVQIGYPAHDADWYRGGATVDLIMCTHIKNYDATTPVPYAGATPHYFRVGDAAWTNWLNANDVTEPSYSLGNIGKGAEWIYDALDIADAWRVDNFEEDPSLPGGGFRGQDYGYNGEDFPPTDPISLSAVDTGFLTLFSPTNAQLKALATYMWTSGFEENMRKLYSDPMDSIIMFGILPLDLSSIRATTTSNVHFGNVDSGIPMYPLLHQYTKLDMGTLTVPENWSNCLDYGSFTQANLYLPAVGYVDLKIDDIMDGTINVIYWIDCLSGDCAVKVWCKKTKKNGKSLSAVCYQYHGNCMIHVPVTGANYGRTYKNQMIEGIKAGASLLTGNLGGFASGVMGAIGAAAEGPQISRSGSYSGSMAALSERRPCLFLIRPIQHMPGGYSEYVGYPSFITYQLEKLEGYTMVDAVIDNQIAGATDAEKEEIERLLKEGVILPERD